MRRVGQMVLRAASCASAQQHATSSTLPAAAFLAARVAALHSASGADASRSSSSAGPRSALAALAGLGAAAFGLAGIAHADAAEVPKASPAPQAGGEAVATPLEGTHQLSQLPYALDALEPYMSGSTLAVHWGKHHRAYLENLNKQVAGTPLEGQPLDKVVVAAWNGGKPTPAFNNAAQAWNHEFFWSCMQPGASPAPPPKSEIAAAIARDFGSLEQFKAAFKAAGLGQFGSGWVWLVSDHDGNLRVMRTANAVTPMASGWNCLLVADVWEHAYYIDYQHKRGDFLDAFLNALVNWEAVEQRYEAVLDAE